MRAAARKAPAPETSGTEAPARFANRIEYAWGDLGADEPFAGVEPRRIRRIVHSAAVTRFNVDEETARRVNIEGTARLLGFAKRCENLESFGFLSTIYASGLRAGPIAEACPPYAGSFGFVWL